MSDDRDALLARLAELDKKALGAEALRLVARLHQIRTEASQLVLNATENPKAYASAEAFAKTANLAEEAAQLGVRLSELREV